MFKKKKFLVVSKRPINEKLLKLWAEDLDGSYKKIDENRYIMETRTFINVKKLLKLNNNILFVNDL